MRKVSRIQGPRKQRKQGTKEGRKEQRSNLVRYSIGHCVRRRKQINSMELLYWQYVIRNLFVNTRAVERAHCRWNGISEFPRGLQNIVPRLNCFSSAIGWFNAWHWTVVSKIISFLIELYTSRFPTSTEIWQIIYAKYICNKIGIFS